MVDTSGRRPRWRPRRPVADVEAPASGGAPPLSRRALDDARAGAGSRPPGKAGRNLPAAITVGVLLGGVVLAALLLRPEAFVLVVALAVGLGVWELTNAFAARHIRVPLVPVVVGSVGMLVSAYTTGEEGLIVAFGLTAFGVLLWRVLDGVEGAVRDVAGGVFTVAYAPFLASFAVLMLAAPDGVGRIITFVVVVIASDIGGYVAGVLLGRHPMAPSVSPKKSWEGFAGSATGCVGAGTVLVPVLLDGPWWGGTLLGLASVVTATLGDLAESMIKRDLGIKDMGSLLPGHGGVMDRLDSLLLTAPVTYLLLAGLVPA